MRKININNMIMIVLVILLLTGCNSQRKKDQASLHMDLGIAYLNSNHFNPALKEFLAAEEFYSDDPRVHYFLAVTYMAKDLRDKAIDELKISISKNKEYSQAHTYLGSIYNSMGLYDQAIDEFNKALKNILYDAPAAALFNMGVSYFKKGDYKTAMLKYEEAIAKDPNTPLLPGIYKNIGIVSFTQGDFEKAVKYFKKSLELVPDFLESQYWLGQSYVKLNRRPEAVMVFQSVIKTAPESPFGIKAAESLKAIDR